MHSSWLSTAALAAASLYTEAVAVNSNACQVAANLQAAALEDVNLTLDGDRIYATFDAETAYKCATSVPFHAAEALVMLDYARNYSSFHTGLAYLKDPPPSYQQPPVDVMASFNMMKAKVKAGQYASQYEFDTDLNSIVIATHEEHFAVAFGVVRLFKWFLPDSFTSVSSDGKSLPQVYAYSDILHDVDGASPVIEIEGQSVFEYLRDYAKRTSPMGLTDPHADWNQLMVNTAWQFGISGAGTDNTYYPSYIESTIIYNGPSLRGTFGNGTDFEWLYGAGSVISLLDYNYTTPEIVYDFYVVNQNLATPTSTSGPSDTTSVTESPRPDKRAVATSTAPSLPTYTRVPYPNYPDNPIVLQDKFAVGGTVSGYLLQDLSVGVLSLPSFSTSSKTGTTEGFSSAVQAFIKRASNAGMKKIVIDISGNGGGTVFQGYDTFRQFFPTIEPSLLFRGVATPQINTLGSIITGLFRGDLDSLGPDEMEVLGNVYSNDAFINAAFSETPDGEDWNSWVDFYGPRALNGGEFTNSAKWNLSAPSIVDELGEYIAGYGNNTDFKQPWPADDIILLSDGSCGSTCSIFAELMKTDAGVKTVVVGGIPEYGPMQSVSGTRGSNDQQWSVISDAVSNLGDLGSLGSGSLKALNVTTQDMAALPRPITEAPWVVHIGAFNALDEIRPGSPDDPLQYTYEAADCRIFYTPAMVRDVTQLWRAASTFIGGNDSVCVTGSTDGPGVDRNSTVIGDTGYSYNKTWTNANSTADPSVKAGSKDNGEGGDSSNDDGDDSSAGGPLSVSFCGLLVAMSVAIML